MLGIADADSEEHGNPSKNLVVSQVACPVPDRKAGASRLTGKLRLAMVPGTMLARIEKANEVVEAFTCNFEANPEFVSRLIESGIVACAHGERGELRAFELYNHPFFLATLYQPQLSSTPERPSPVFIAFVKAAQVFFEGRRAGG